MKTLDSILLASLFVASEFAGASVIVLGGEGAGTVVDGIGGSAQFSATYNPTNRRVGGGGSTSGGFGGVFASISLTGPDADERFSFAGSATALAGAPLAYSVFIYVDFQVAEPMSFSWRPNLFTRGASFSGSNDPDGILNVGTTYRVQISLDRSLGDPNQTDFVLDLQTIPTPGTAMSLAALATLRRRRR